MSRDRNLETATAAFTVAVVQDISVSTKRRAQTQKAREVRTNLFAHKAADDPIALRRATLIVRAALHRDRISIADLTPLPPIERRSA